MADQTTKVQSIDESNKKPEDKYNRWQQEIALAEKEQDPFIKSGRTIYERYKDERKGGETDSKKFNVFSTNVGIMQSSLFAKVPKAAVSRRFGQQGDDPARVASMMIQNILLQDMEDETCNFAQVMKYAITDWLVPGWGHAWIRLETDTEEKTLEAIFDEFGNETQEESKYEQVTDQNVAIDYVHWDDFLVSPCRTWEERRWVCRMVYMDKDKLTKRFGAEKANQVSLDYTPGKDGDDDTPLNNIVDKAVVYEIWDRMEKKVIWFCKGYKEILDEKDDPLKLENFDPCPRPLFALHSTGNVLPRADWIMIQDQYTELDQVNNRISKLVEACKVVGVYDSASGASVGRMLKEGSDNTLIPVDNWAMFAEKGGVDGVIDWLPLTQVIAALEKLRQAREDIKAQIYELTGISDIVRGNTKASETLGAQQIKAQFASVRIQKQQDQVALFAQELLSMKAQIICRHFTPEQILIQSNFQYYPDMQDPDLVMAAVDLIKEDYEAFEWRVKVEADSMAMADYAMQKEEKIQFTNATATFLQSAGKLLEMNLDLAPIIFGTLKFAISGFRGAAELEGVIDNTIKQMEEKIKQQQSQPPPPDPAQIKAQQDSQQSQQKHQQDMEKGQQDAQLKVVTGEQELAHKQKANALDQQHSQVMNMMEIIKKKTDMILDRKAKIGRPEKTGGS